jgi:hypothetical protein
MAKQYTLTIHGICTPGDWQEDVKYVLEPHFHCESIKYPHFRDRLAPLRLIFDLRVLCILAPVVLLLQLFSLLPHPGWWWAGALFVSHLGSYQRRKDALTHVLTQMDPYLCFQENYPHLIAHSLGTYLTGRIIKKVPTSHFSHMVLAGCILRRKLDLQGFKSSPRGAFDRIRNEMQTWDWVVALAAALGTLVRDFGIAGLWGFRKIAHFTHSVESPQDFCYQCTVNFSLAPVHNVKCREFSHSGVFLSRSYAAYMWLPFLWGIEPPEYAHFVRTCSLAARKADLLTAKKVALSNWDRELGTEEGELDSFPWSWTAGSLHDYLRKLIQDHKDRRGRPTDAFVLPAVRGVWQHFRRASDAFGDRSTLGWEERVLALYPPTACIRAVDDLLA